MAFDWKKTLGTVAPGIATMLGGPLAGMATSAVMDYFGIESTGDESQDEASLSQKVAGMTPADAIELKKIEANLAIELKKVGVDIYKIEVEDRQGARDMRVKMGGDIAGDIISFLVVAGWILVNYVLFTSSSDMPNRDMIMRALGTLDAAVMCVLYYYRGSSYGSRKKDEAKANGK